MSRSRVSTTVDEGLLSEARLANPGRNDAALLARARALAIDASYGAYDEHPIDEPDEWGDRSHTQSTYFGYARGMELDTRLLVRDYGMVVNGAGDVPALEAVGDGALTVLNLFALREVAAYEDDRSCSGFEAMLRYSAVSGDRLAAVGGSFIAKALPTGVVWGEDDNWDVLVVAMLPSVRAFWSLLADPTYRKAFAHRRAAISRQRVTVAVPLP